MYWLEKETWEIGLFRPIGKTTQLTWPFNLWCFKICNVYEERGEWNRIISPMRSTYLQHWSQVRGGCQRAGILHFLTLHTCSRVCGLLIWQWRDISGVRECLANPQFRASSVKLQQCHLKLSSGGKNEIPSLSFCILSRPNQSWKKGKSLEIGVCDWEPFWLMGRLLTLMVLSNLKMMMK